MSSTANTPRFALRRVLVAGVPLLAVWLWWVMPPRTDDPWRGRAHAWAVSPITSARLGVGDDPRWADPAFDDSAWPEVNLGRLPWSDGVFWLRIRMDIAPPGDPAVMRMLEQYTDLRHDVLERTQRFGVNALSVEAGCAQEVFWQGRPVGRSGVPGATAQTEEPGNHWSYYPLPTGLTAPGHYVIAVRLSHAAALRLGPYFAYLPDAGRLDDEVTRNWIYSLGSMAVLAVGLVGAAFCLVAWWLIDRRAAFATFAVFCLLIGTIGGGWIAREIGWVKYPGYLDLQLVGAWANLAAGVMLLLSAVVFLDLPRRSWWMLLAVPAVLIAPTTHPAFFLRGTWLLQWFYAATLFVALAGWALRRRGAGWVAAAVLVPWAADLLGWQVFAHNFGDMWVAPIVVLFGVGLFRSIGLTLRSEQLRARQGQLTSARLETELLKRNIQPHFLLNSLGSIAQFVEEDPAIASRMIDALAEEFRIVSRVSQQKQIPLRDEIELCEAHLRVMSLRREARYRLETEIADDAIMVPPALLHTLVENAITHGGPVRDGERVLRVTEAQLPDGRRVIELHSPVSQPSIGGAGVSEGTGTRYVKARLEESYPGRWHFESGPVPGGWRTRIEIVPAPVPVGAT
ncbi:MAG TPA: histidine kinase [Candidatus Didemnitutus sp.]|nr:histidine kinase [Candidatus Didemnitutus sp.]